MSREPFSIVERHVEKAVLGICAAFVVLVFGMYFVGQPNRIEYREERFGPRTLARRVLSDAGQLEQAMNSKRGAEPSIARFGERLRKEHDAGISGAGPGETLPRATSFGVRSDIAGLDETDNAPGSVTLVTPLPPGTPMLRTGLSMAIRSQADVSGAVAPAASAEQPAAAETAWVTAAAYFPKSAQFREMITAGYAPYRSRAYVTQVQAERQELLANGSDWSDWTPVKSHDSTPPFDLAEPRFDERGELLNKRELDQLFQLVRQEQNRIMQPPFHAVIAGEPWEIPPIARFEDELDEGAGIPRYVERRTEPAPTPTVHPKPGSVIEESIRTTSALPDPELNAAQRRAAGRKMVRQCFDRASRALQQREYQAAIDLAARAVANEFASQRDEDQANLIIHRALKRRDRLARNEDVASSLSMPLVRDSETNDPAIWCHDETVAPGRTYRYRVRVLLWNRYVGQARTLTNPELARSTVLVGDWSEPSDPITVTPTTCFFVKGGRPDAATANVDVWRWREGAWLHERFDVRAGDSIGSIRSVRIGVAADGRPVRGSVDFSTGATVLDVRHNERVTLRTLDRKGNVTLSEKTTTVVVYRDPLDGQVKERSQFADTQDPILIRLEEDDG